jgi:transcription factor C subunit 7
MNWTIDHTTGTYHSTFPTPTGNPSDPTLTAHGVRQSQELAAHLASDGFAPKPWRIYCSPFYRCLQTIQPGVEALKEGKRRISSDDDDGVDLDVRIENGLG